jgi:hypothetical protein
MIGLSFAPIGNPNEPGSDSPNGPVNPVQEAIKVLTHALLAGLGSAGSSPIEQILAQLFGQGMGGTSAPIPDFDMTDDAGQAANGITFHPPEPPQAPTQMPTGQAPSRMPRRGDAPFTSPYGY